MDAPRTDAVARHLQMNYVYYPGSVHENGRDFGNAVLSRWPIVADKKLILPHRDPERRAHPHRGPGHDRDAAGPGLGLQRAQRDALARPARTPGTGRRRRRPRARLRPVRGRRRRLQHLGPGLLDDTVALFRSAGFVWASDGIGETAGMFTLDHIFVKRLAALVRVPSAPSERSPSRMGSRGFSIQRPSGRRPGQRLASAAAPATARTSPPARCPPAPHEVSLNADVLVIDRGLGPQLLPAPELGYRFGVLTISTSEGALNAGSLELNARWRFLQDTAADLALVPALGFGFVPATNPDTGTFNAHLLGSARSRACTCPKRTDSSCWARAGGDLRVSGDRLQRRPHRRQPLLPAGGVAGAALPGRLRAYLFPELNVLFPVRHARDEWYFPTLQAAWRLQFE